MSGKQAKRDKRILALGIALPSEMNLTSPLIGGVAVCVEYKMVKNHKVEVENKRLYPLGVMPE